MNSCRPISSHEMHIVIILDLVEIPFKTLLPVTGNFPRSIQQKSFGKQTNQFSQFFWHYSCLNKKKNNFCKVFRSGVQIHKFWLLKQYGRFRVNTRAGRPPNILGNQYFWVLFLFFGQNLIRLAAGAFGKFLIIIRGGTTISKDTYPPSIARL